MSNKGFRKTGVVWKKVYGVDGLVADQGNREQSFVWKEVVDSIA